MITARQVLEAALVLADELTPQQEKWLEALCGASFSSLSAQLRDGISPEDCEHVFLLAAAMMALSALETCSAQATTEQITAGDFTIRKDAPDWERAAACLTKQAATMMAPYLQDRFSFRGV